MINRSPGPNPLKQRKQTFFFRSCAPTPVSYFCRFILCLQPPKCNTFQYPAGQWNIMKNVYDLGGYQYKRGCPRQRKVSCLEDTKITKWKERVDGPNQLCCSVRNEGGRGKHRKQSHFCLTSLCQRRCHKGIIFGALGHKSFSDDFYNRDQTRKMDADNICSWHQGMEKKRNKHGKNPARSRRSPSRAQKFCSRLTSWPAKLPINTRSVC